MIGQYDVIFYMHYKRLPVLGVWSCHVEEYVLLGFRGSGNTNFPVWLPNRSISVGLEPVLSHNENHV